MADIVEAHSLFFQRVGFQQGVGAGLFKAIPLSLSPLRMRCLAKTINFAIVSVWRSHTYALHSSGPVPFLGSQLCPFFRDIWQSGLKKHSDIWPICILSHPTSLNVYEALMRSNMLEAGADTLHKYSTQNSISRIAVSQG